MTHPASGAEADVEVTAEPGSSVASLLAASPIPIAGQPCYLGRPNGGSGSTVRLDPDATLAAAGITHGCVVSVGAPAPVPAGGPAAAAGVLEIVEGPGRGNLHWTAPGRHILGRGTGASVRFEDLSVSRAHAGLDLGADPDAASVVDLGSSNGTTLDGQPLGAGRLLHAGSRIGMGDTVLQWTPLPARAAHGTPSPDGRLDFDRAFAPAPAIPRTRITFPDAAAESSALVRVLLTAGAPLLGGALMAWLFRQPAMLLFAVLGPLMALGPYLSERRARGNRSREQRVVRERAERDLAEHVRREEQARTTLTPDRVHLAAVATGTGRGLWPRGGESAHGLVVRVGTADAEAALDLHGMPGPGFRPPVLRAAPVTVDLRRAGVLGVVGEPHDTGPLVRWLVTQLAVLRSPEDLALAVLVAKDADAEDDLSWTRWLPHVEVGETGRAPCRTGVTAATRTARLTELAELVAARRTAADGGQVDGWPQEVVVLLQGAVALRRLPGIRQVLREGPAVGVHAICVDRQDMNECHALCAVDGDRLVLTPSRQEPPVVVRPEGLDLAAVGGIARALAPMRDRLTPVGAQAGVPYPVRYLDLVGMPEPSPEHVRQRWATRPGPTTEAVLGADGAGPVCVDLARQGPHTMLGGATGAGKSILLQTLVTALLLDNRPDELNLVLVDFKGGSAFLPFASCPHVVGLIRSTGSTPAEVFDEAAAVRVLASVRAEVRRRESILAPYGGELDEYWRARRTDRALPALPRLVMIFDEFARVLETSPDFLRELVNVSAKGRSLGIHLVLATQSLQGKLSPELKNNIDLRISLRQNEVSDSVEVLGAPDAVGIPGHLRGRGMILCTKDEVRLPRVFQSGYLGDVPPDGGAAPARVRVVDWPSLGADRPEPDAVPRDGQTDQTLVIAAIEQAARELAVPAPSRPLLPPLPAVVRASDVDRLATVAPALTAVPFGLVDDPAGQAQLHAVLDLAGNDRLLIAGGPQSGRTTAARALVRALAVRFRPEQVHLYVVEQHPGGLVDAARLPHCGAVLSPAEPDRIRRFVTWLEGEVQRRKSARSTGATALPWIVVVIDGWEQFENRSDPTFVESSLLARLRAVITAGTPLGVHVVALGGQDLLAGKLPALFSRRILLPFPQEDVRRAHLLPGTPRPPLVPGRGIDAATGRQVQVVDAMADLAELGDLQWPIAGAAPVRFPSLPVAVPSRDVARPDGVADTWVPLGVGGQDVSSVGVDLFEAGPHLLLISGPAGSGRTGALAALGGALRRAGVGVLAVAPPRSPLPGLLPADDGVRLVSGTTVKDGDLRDAVAAFGDGRYAMLVDDFEQLTVVPEQDGFTDQPTLLQDLAAPGALGTRALVLAGDALPVLSGQRRNLMRVVTEAMTSGRRLLLTPTQPMAAREHGVSLEPDQFLAGPPGRGYLTDGSDLQLVQLALPS